MVRILKTVSQIDVSGAMIFHKCSCSKSICHNSLLNSCISGVYMTACDFHFPMRLPMNPDRDSCKTQVLQHPYPGSVEHSHKSAFREHWASDLQSICDNSSTDSDIRQCLILDLQSICVSIILEADLNSQGSIILQGDIHTLTWVHKLTWLDRLTPEPG